MFKIFTFLVLIFLTSCSFIKKDSEQNDELGNVKKKPTTINVKDRALADDSKGFFTGKKDIDPLGKQNVMWRATINALDFIPLQSVNYDGGSIITDWYSADNSNESVKINVIFNSNEIRTSSVKVKSFKKSCSSANSCKISSMGESFNNKIKEQIFEEVKKININEKIRK